MVVKVYLPDDEYAELQEAARADMRSMSGFMRRALSAHIRRSFGNVGKSTKSAGKPRGANRAYAQRIL